MATPPRRMPYYLKLYALFSQAIILSLPFLLLTLRGNETEIPDRVWYRAFGWVLICLAGYVYARKRCSSQALPFQDGLMYALYSIRVWGMGGRVLLMVPTVFLVCFGSALLAMVNDLTGKTRQTPQAFHKMILKIYQHRMVR